MNDYCVCTTWGIFDGKRYLLDLFRQKLDYPSLKRAVYEQWQRHKPHKVVIEDKSSGMALLQELASLGIFGVNAYKPTGDKTMRCHAQSTKFEDGSVLLPREASWLGEYIRELTGFPGGRHDDQVDSTTQALDFISTQCQKAEMWARLGRG